MPEKLPFEINTKDLIPVFGQALYTDFGALIRELVQNSHDAIIQAGHLGHHMIWLHFDQSCRKLYVVDNGAGIHPDHISSKLNHFAFSDKAEELSLIHI